MKIEVRRRSSSLHNLSDNMLKMQSLHKFVPIMILYWWWRRREVNVKMKLLILVSVGDAKLNSDQDRDKRWSDAIECTNLLTTFWWTDWMATDDDEFHHRLSNEIFSHASLWDFRVIQEVPRKWAQLQSCMIEISSQCDEKIRPYSSYW